MDFQVKNVDTMALTVTVRDQGKSSLNPPALNAQSVDIGATVPAGTADDPKIEILPWLKDKTKFVIELTLTDDLGTTIYFGPRNYNVTGTSVLQIKHDMAPKDP